MAQKGWPKEEEAQLRRLLDEGKIPAEICQIMGKSVGAISGKMSRLNLTGKNNPKADRSQGRVFSGRGSPRKPKAALLEAVQAVTPTQRVMHAQCKWPLGEPREKDFRYCNVPVFERRTPYCSAHKATAYVKLRTSVEEHA